MASPRGGGASGAWDDGRGDFELDVLDTANMLEAIRARAAEEVTAVEVPSGDAVEEVQALPPTLPPPPTSRLGEED